MSNPGVVVVVAVRAVVCMVVAVVGIRISDSFSEENRVIKSSSFFQRPLSESHYLFWKKVPSNVYYLFMNSSGRWERVVTNLPT